MACRDAIRAEAARQPQLQKQSVGGEITQGNYLGPASYHRGNLWSGGQGGPWRWCSGCLSIFTSTHCTLLTPASLTEKIKTFPNMHFCTFYPITNTIST